ncbi:MAG: DnaD domain protein [Bacillota bacterium]
MNKVEIIKQNKIHITGDTNSHSVEIDKDVIDNGFLKKFPDSTLAIFLYLITHLNQKNKALIEPSTISDFLPCDLQSVVKGLNYLKENDIINIVHNKEKPLEIKINFETISSSSNQNKSNNIDNNNNSSSSKNKDLPYSSILEKNSLTVKEITEALISLIPPDKKKEKIIENINQWVVDFESEVLKELIRRVSKWQKNTNHTKDKAFYYMKAIIDDWYDKEIFTYDRLQYFDKLYRETKELAQVYGVNWHNLKSVQMQTLQSWLTDDFALSLDLAKFAIKQAIKRKKDGEPSLQYIEDNFIKPWKKQQIKNIAEAKKYLAANRSTGNSDKSNNSTQKSTKKSDLSSPSDWNQFSWNLEELIRGG